MTNPDVEVISDPYRAAVVVQRRVDGSYALRGPKSMLILSAAEIARLSAFANRSPKLGRLERFPVV